MSYRTWGDRGCVSSKFSVVAQNFSRLLRQCQPPARRHVFWHSLRHQNSWIEAKSIMNALIVRCKGWTLSPEWVLIGTFSWASCHQVSRRIFSLFTRGYPPIIYDGLTRIAFPIIRTVRTEYLATSLISATLISTPRWLSLKKGARLCRFSFMLLGIYSTCSLLTDEREGCFCYLTK